MPASPLLISDAFAESAIQLGFNDVDQVPTAIREPIIRCINAVMQELATARPDFFQSEPDTVTLSAASYTTLDDAITELVEPPRYGAKPLMACNSIGELENLGRRFTEEGLSGAPRVYFLASYDPGTDAADAASLRLYVRPTPLITYDVDVIVRKKPSVFDVSDCCSDTPIPVAHAFAETLFRPLLRAAISENLPNYVFPSSERAARIEMDLRGAEMARAKFGMSSPREREMRRQGRNPDSEAA